MKMLQTAGSLSRSTHSSVVLLFEMVNNICSGICMSLFRALAPAFLVEQGKKTSLTLGIATLVLSTDFLVKVAPDNK